jgi:hypothetical protein
MQRFAGGHKCTVIHSDSCVVFQKMPPRALAT